MKFFQRSLLSVVTIAAYATPIKTEQTTLQKVINYDATIPSAPVKPKQTTLQKVINHGATIPAAAVITAATVLSTGVWAYKKNEKRQLINRIVDQANSDLNHMGIRRDPVEEAEAKKILAKISTKQLQKMFEQWYATPNWYENYSYDDNEDSDDDD